MVVRAAGKIYDMWMPLWICLQEKAHEAREIQQGRELSARAAFFFLWMVGV